jgi:hypothetical protein
MTMTAEREQFVSELTRLISQYRHDSDTELLAAAGVLATLAGAVCSGRVEALMQVTAKFSDREVKRLTATYN